jgi:ferredoxin
MELVFDPIACDGHGMCAELLPELIVLDDWGYPMVKAGEVPPGLEKHARRAVAACPKLAFTLRRTDGRGSSPVSPSGRR